MKTSDAPPETLVSERSQTETQHPQKRPPTSGELDTSQSTTPQGNIELRTSSRPARGVVVMIHGMTSTPSEMEPLGSFLAERGYDVFIPLLSGHGTSIEELKRTPKGAWLADAHRAFERCLETNHQKVIVIGASFGSLLALTLGAERASDVEALVLLSPPFRLKKRSTERLLHLLSLLPEKILNLLGTQQKVARAPGTFSFPRRCYDAHSFGALARMMHLREEVTSKLHRITAPVLILQDPSDHHLSPDSAAMLQKRLTGDRKIVEVCTIPGGEHELVIGTKYREVFESVEHFLDKHRSNKISNLSPLPSDS